MVNYKTCPETNVVMQNIKFLLSLYKKPSIYILIYSKPIVKLSEFNQELAITPLQSVNSFKKKKNPKYNQEQLLSLLPVLYLHF